MMAKLQATLRALAPNYRSLAELGAQVNEILCRDGLPNRFASLVYLELESGSNAVRILNAGHMPAIIIREDRSQEMPLGSPALGLKRKIAFTEQQIELKQGELLFIYSDGITDARNEAGKFFGEQRMMKLLQQYSRLSIERIGKNILAEVERFIDEARLYDDLSMVILKRIGK
jgi:sigma-B regulation protein RsbU (phosphoserine phosphatase)